MQKEKYILKALNNIINNQTKMILANRSEEEMRSGTSRLQWVFHHTIFIPPEIMKIVFLHQSIKLNTRMTEWKENYTSN